MLRIPEVEPACELIRSVTSNDDYRLQYRCWPAHGNPKAIVLLLHGLISHSGWFRELAVRLTLQGYHVVGADRRGSGLNRLQRGDAPSTSALIADLEAVVAKERADLALYVVGWCWGAVSAANLALQSQCKVAGLALLAPGLFPSNKVRSAFMECLARTSCRDSEAGVPSPITDDMFSTRADVVDFIRRDADAVRLFTPRFFRIARAMSLGALARLPRLNIPLLLLLADMDATVDNDQALDAVQKVSRVHVAAKSLPCSHAMNLEMPEAVASTFHNWVMTNEPQPEQGVRH